MAFQDKLKPVSNFQSKLKPIKPKGEFRFDVPEQEVARQGRIQQYQAEAQKSAEEAKKANSFMGILGNTVKGVGETLANSEVGLGRSLAKIIGAGDTTLQEAQKSSTDTEVALLKRIREKEGKGEDTTRLKQAYNQLKGGQGEVNTQLKEQFNLPSTGKVAGQIGGTALDLLTAGTYSKLMQPGKLAIQGPASAKVASTLKLPSSMIQGGQNLTKTVATATGLPELGTIATQKASGMFTKKGLGNIATGAGIGYASDVTQGLQGARGEEREGAKAFIPGLGTALGTAIPAISEGNQSIKNRFTEEGRNTQIAVKRRNALIDAEKKYAKVGKAFAMGDKKGVDVRSILSETNLLNGAVDEDGLISAERALTNFDEFVAPYENKVRTAIQSENAKVKLADIASRMDDFVAKTDLQGGAQTKLTNELFSDLKGLQARYGDNIPVEALHDIKIFRGNASNYTDTGANIINKDATRFFKEAVEDNVRSLDVKSYNGELSKLYTVRDAIESLNRARVKGGRAGKYFSSLIGTGIGASSGNPLLAILGAEIGAKTQGAVLERSLGGNITKGMQLPEGLGNILSTKVPRENVIPPVVIPKKKTPGTLDLQSSSKEGSLNTSQSKTAPPTKNAIPKTILPVKEVSSKAKGQGGEMFAGGAIGFEQDENGEWQFNEEKALAGMVGVAGLTRSQAVQKLSKDLDGGTRKIMVDFIDAVRLNMTNKGGQFTFKNAETMTSEQAEKAFDKGIDLIQGEAGKGLKNEKIQQSLPKTLAKFYEDVVGSNRDKNYKSAEWKKANETKPTLLEEAKKYKSAEEFYQYVPSGVRDELRAKGIKGSEQIKDWWIKNSGVTNEKSYGMSHRPTETGATADDISQNKSGMGFPKDFYENPHYYAQLSQKADSESWKVLQRIKGNPEAEVTIYRASPKNELNEGDWVTLSKEYAKGESLAEGVPINSFKVKAKDIQFAGDSINEFGYFPKSQLTDIWKQANKKDSLESLAKGKTLDEFVKGQGTPMYHGSPAKFEKFTTKYMGIRDSGSGGMLGDGIYITAVKGKNGGAKMYGDNVMEVFADIKNPFVMNDPYAFGGIDPSKIRKALDLPTNSTSKQVQEELIKRGHDGVQLNRVYDTYKNGMPTGTKLQKNVEVVVFRPEQIKTKSQLIDIWKKANETKPTLLEEAKKYKSAEEFVKAQTKDTYIHGTKKPIEGDLQLKSKALGVAEPESNSVDVLYVTPSDDVGVMHSRMYTKEDGVTYSIKLKPGAKIFDYTNPQHKKMLDGKLTEVQQSLIERYLIDGQLYWAATPPPKLIKSLGFDGMKAIERKAGEEAFDEAFKTAKYKTNAESIAIFNKDAFTQVDTLTKSQLTDIWNEANRDKK